ncbi:unnamed protein product [Urochloa decumbens]|uniref:Uncharacterized protein n=1 Tax=Urochloa decumbens TaxID=240449 RepID=A0ABC8Z4X6_9POAL
MASFVVRAAASSSLPFGRARCLGSGRLPLAALPGHDAVVLAGRRVGTGCGGVLKVALNKAPARDVKVACAKAGPGPDSMGDEEAFEKMYSIRSKQFDQLLGLYMPLPIQLSIEEKAVQEKLKEISEKCIILAHDAMRRLPRAERRRLDNIFWQAHRAFATVKSRATDGRASLGMAVVIAEKLDVVRKMVSFGSNTPLPIDMKGDKKLIMPFTAPVFPIEHGIEVLVFTIIDNLYEAVKADVEAMLSASSRT